MCSGMQIDILTRYFLHHFFLEEFTNPQHFFEAKSYPVAQR